MREPSGRVLAFLILSSVLLAADCATITRRSKQRIPVTSHPVGATVIVNGVQQGVTPLVLRLPRKEKGQVIRIESPGYNPVEIRPKRKMSGGPMAGNFALGLMPGAVLAMGYGMEHDEDENVDMMSMLIWMLSAAAFGGLFTAVDSGGKGYELEPRELTVTLTKAEGPPRVETIVIEAGDFQAIKWIRVRRD
jgi:hypothetical protein